MSHMMLKKNVNFYVNFNTLLFLCYLELSKKGRGGGRILQNNWIADTFTYHKLCLIFNLFCSTAKNVILQLYGYITNWKSTGYFEVYHSVPTYRVRDLPNSAMVSPGQCND